MSPCPDLPIGQFFPRIPNTWRLDLFIFLSGCELFISVSMSKTVIRLHVLSKVYPVSSHDTHDARTWCTTSKPQSGPNSPGISTSVCSTFFLINIGGFQQVPSSLSVACLSLACSVCLFGIDNNLSWTMSNVLIHVLYILNWYHTF